MEQKIKVKAIRTFEGSEGFKTLDSEPFEVARGRFADLKANGLVEAVKNEVAPEATKQAEAPKNKMAPDAENKAVISAPVPPPSQARAGNRRA